MRTEIAFGQKKWAVVGANNHPEKFGYKIYKMLKEAGFIVYPVNPSYTEVLGDPCYADLHSLPEKVDMVSVVVRPDQAERYIADYDAVFWFQPGTFTDSTLAAVKGEYIADRCVLVEHRQAEIRTAKFIHTAVKWLKERVSEAGAKGLVLGLSGGVDSAVVGALIKKAFPEHSKGLILPCYSSSQDIEHGKKVAEAIGLSYEVLDLTTVHAEMMRLFDFARKSVSDGSVTASLSDGEKTGEVASDGGVSENAASDAETAHRKSMRASDSNLRARLRMSAIYAYANYHGDLTVGTDNAAELHIGYFTKYGDGGVDLLPIAQLLKCEVFAMARMLGVPKEVLYKAPSAGLWEGQTDEGEIGTTYDEIDRFLMGEPVSDVSARIIERMNRVSEHKRHTPPYPVLK